MARDIFGNLIKRDPWTGKKIPKKRIKKEVIAENRRKGQAAEDAYKMRAQLEGYEVERTGRGHDFRVRKRNLLTGRVTYSGVREIKSGNAKLSKLQQKTKKKKSNYKVVREEPMFW
ncbi:MAG: hypothetical protein HYS32_01330 [Candidatus Woesearchaeota archaeon]|nr:MAG: hypothetical protein HYS32_01330 [Candidatus Woesearchaeota archaeon]